MAVVVPHEARDPVTGFDAVCCQRMGQLCTSCRGNFQGLAVCTIGKQGDDFYIRIKLCTAAQNSGEKKRRLLHCH